MSVRKNNFKICAAYKCRNEALIPRRIDGHTFYFCPNHLNVLDHGKTSVILDIISSEKLNDTTILKRFNFSTVGFNEDELFSTIGYLESVKEVKKIGGFFYVSGYENNCEFYGCQLRKHNGYNYCSNHKNLPSMSFVDAVIKASKSFPKNAFQIEGETGIDIKIVKSILFQLVKFGYTMKEKKGVTNYYICK
jgi:Zn-finger protein